MSDDIELYEDLANAIIICAAQDYRKALKKLKKNPKSSSANSTKDEVEKFFRSEWFSFLSDVSGEQLIERLRAEQAEGADSLVIQKYLRVAK